MSVMGRTANDDGEGGVPPGIWCGYCSNTGIVLLEGTVRVGPTTYSRGASTCKFCDQGALRHAEATAPSGQRKVGNHVCWHSRWEPSWEYDRDDVVYDVSDELRDSVKRFVPTTEFLVEREAAGVPRAVLCLLFDRGLWPDGWVAPERGIVRGMGGSDASRTVRNIETAKVEKNLAERVTQPEGESEDGTRNDH